jgi:hypothetical protein
MEEIIKMGKPVADTLIEMLEEAGKYNLKVVTKKGAIVPITQRRLRKKSNLVKWVDFSGIRQEIYCEHGVGHGYHVHGCDGCCGHKSFGKEFKKWQRKS